jgi:hypothetical protein
MYYLPLYYLAATETSLATTSIDNIICLNLTNLARVNVLESYSLFRGSEDSGAVSCAILVVIYYEGRKTTVCLI